MSGPSRAWPADGVESRVATAADVRAALWAIALVGAAVRIAAMFFWTGAIDPEGAEYARIAENLLSEHRYRGIVTPGVELMFPPLYPLLIAAASYVVGNAELAARLVCVLSGSLLPVAMFAVASRIYDRRTSLWVAGTGALHPLLISASAWTYSEAPYMTVVMFGLYLTMGGLRGGRPIEYAGAGLVFGAAYLIRPEGLILPCIAAVFIAAVQWRTPSAALRRVALLIGVFAVVAAPYVAFVSYYSGRLRFEGKTPINFEMSRRLLGGEDYLDIIYGVGPNLEPTGVFMRPNQDVIAAAKVSVTEVRRIASRAGRNVALLISTLLKPQFGSPLLLLLAVLGLFGRPWPPGRRAEQVLLVAVLGATAASLLTTLLADNSRYCWFYVPVLLIWAMNGARHLAEWATETVRPSVGRAGRTSWAWAVRGALVAVMVVASVVTVEDPLFGRQSRPTKDAGLWLRDREGRRVTVMDTQTNLAFHAGAEFVYVPNARAETILAYADAKKVDFIVVRPRHPWVVGRRVLEEWGINGLDHPRARLVYEWRGSPTQEIFIYEWKRAEGKLRGAKS